MNTDGQVDIILKKKNKLLFKFCRDILLAKHLFVQVFP